MKSFSHRFKLLVKLFPSLLLLLVIFSPISAKNSKLIYTDEEKTINNLLLRTVSGNVIDAETDEPLIGVNIVIKDSSTGTSTDVDGNYSLNIPTEMEGVIILEFSYTGYLTETRNIPNQEGNITIDVNMQIANTSLNAITVTASKRTQTVMETPISIQALSGKKMAEAGLRDLSEVIALVPGATETVSNNIGQRQYQMRGVPQVKGDPTVGYYLDEAAFSFFGGIFSPVARSFDINRVEVLRGPQSTLYGNGAMGGVIRFIPNKPNLTKIQGEVVGGFNTVKGGDAGYFGDVMLNFPIVKEKLGVRFAGSYEEVGGFIESLETDAENINGGDLTQFRTQLLYQPLDDLKIELTYQKNVTEQNVGSFADDIEIPASTFNPDNFFQFDNDWYIGTLSYDFKNFATLTSVTSLIKGSNEVQNIVNIPTIGELTINVEDEISALNHETRLTSNSQGPFQWIAGFYFIDSEANSLTLYDNPSFPNIEQNLSSKALSFFGEASYGLLEDKLKVLVGLRSFSDDRASEEDREPQIDTTFTSVNPRFNLSYRPNATSMYFVNIAKGFRSGVFNDQFTRNLHNVQNLPAQAGIDSDKLWSYEIGTKNLFADAQVSLELSAYYQIWRDMQNTLPDPVGGLFATYQVGDVEIPGVDISMSYSPKSVEGLSFQTVVSFNDAKFKEINPVLKEQLNAQDGDRIQLVPAWTLGFTTNYSYSLGKKGWKGNALLSLSHADGQIGFGEDALGGAQTQLRVRLGFQNNKFDFVLFGNNLLGESDAIYIQNSTGAPLSYIPRPQSFGLQAGYRF